jgi:cell division protein FtsW (lipid II flippase)
MLAIMFAIMFLIIINIYILYNKCLYFWQHKKRYKLNKSIQQSRFKRFVNIRIISFSESYQKHNSLWISTLCRR